MNLSKVIAAFIDLMDGVQSHDLHCMTGLSEERCLEIYSLARLLATFDGELYAGVVLRGADKGKLFGPFLTADAGREHMRSHLGYDKMDFTPSGREVPVYTVRPLHYDHPEEPS